MIPRSILFMYSEDPKNRKAPSILLGFIAITGALILALFLTGILKAHAETDLPYNYIAFVEITNSDVTFNDMSGEVLYSLPTFSGAPIPNQNYEAALNNLLAYIPASECLVFIVDNLATKAVYEYVLDSFTSRYVTVLEVNTTIFPFDLTGYEIGYYPAGMWNVPIYTKSVPLTPTVSPTPTPEPERSSLVFHANSNMYFLIDFYGSNVGNTSVNVPSNSVLQSLQSEYNSIDDAAINSVLLMRALAGSTNANFVNLWFNADSIDEVKIYILNSAPIDLDYTRENNTPYTFTVQTVGDGFNDSLNNKYQNFNDSWSGYLAKDSTTLKRFCLNLRYYYNSSNISWGVDSVTGSLASNFFSLQLDNYFTGDRPFSWTYGSTQYGYGLRYQINFNEYEYPYVTPSPSPIPTPTDAPHVNINWPSGTPTPSPPFSVPGNSGTGSGSSGSGSLSPGQIDSTLDTFKSYTENNNAFAFLYACTSVIPDEALYFLFILLFILLLLACIRLFVHFTG